MKLTDFLKTNFEEQHNQYWFNLSRLTNLLIALNLTLFFISKLVITHGYYYTYYSLLCLGVVQFGLVAPLGLFKRLWYYMIFFIFECIAVYFLVVSAWYWVITDKTV